MSTFIRKIGMRHESKGARWKTSFALYLCDCGAEYEASMAQVKRGKSYQKCIKCGEKDRIKKISTSKTKHGMKGTKLYSVYYSMLDRVLNEKSEQYHNYGGRGIYVCDDWLTSNEKFFGWAKENGYEDGLTLERENNSDGYTPSNCVWVKRYTQAQNQRRLKRELPIGATWHGRKTKKIRVQITSNGERHSLGVFSTKIEAAEAYNNFCIMNKTRHTLNKIEEWN